MQTKEIQKVLVANRGEIAMRIFRACHDLGLQTIAIYSNEDTYSLFRTKADEAYLVGEKKSPLGAYLDIPGIIGLAKRRGVTAIHPGYGFLSENADFARRCEEEGVIFIGPGADIIAKMGIKTEARKIMREAGLPIVPGTEAPVQGIEEVKTVAKEVGYPIMLKALAGGGGKGMRLVRRPLTTELEALFIPFLLCLLFGRPQHTHSHAPYHGVIALRAPPAIRFSAI